MNTGSSYRHVHYITYIVWMEKIIQSQYLVYNLGYNPCDTYRGMILRV